MLKKIFTFVFFILIAVVLFTDTNIQTIAAGIALFLFGIINLEDGFKIFANGPLQKVLKKTTNKLWKSLTFGIVTTTFMQSSSLVSVLTISFLGAGLIGLTQGIGIIFGANIGTTTGAWIIAGFGLKVNISAYALPMLIFGILFMFQKNKTLKGLGSILTGLGFLFLGIHYMKDGFEMFKDTIDLASFSMTGIKGLLVYIGIGVFATVVMQSSHATLVLIITALAANQITYENALALAIGANVGTTITAVLGSLSSNISGKRLAGAHLIFNFTTGFIAIVFINQLVLSVEFISSKIGIAPDDYTLKLAVFHTIFNVVGVIIMLPFIGKMEKFLVKHLKEKKVEQTEIKPMYLHESVLSLPATTINALSNESKRLFVDYVFKIVAHASNLHRKSIYSDETLIEVIKKSTKEIDIDIDKEYYSNIKNIYSEILKYAALAQMNLNLSEESNEAIFHIKVANRKMVEIIKGSKELQKNIDLAIRSDNVHTKKIYDKLRKKLLKVLRAIYKYSQGENDDEKSIYFQKLKNLELNADLKRRDSNSLLDSLIREEKISVITASSLFNDIDLVHDITIKLVEVTELLYDKYDMVLEGGNA